jgi:hypothetical protein
MPRSYRSRRRRGKLWIHSNLVENRTCQKNGRVFSVILLPTSERNVACDHCFEHKELHRLSSALLPLLGAATLMLAFGLMPMLTATAQAQPSVSGEEASDLHPRSGLEMLSGRIMNRPNPGLKPWAVLYSRFAAKSDRLLSSVASHK